MCVCVCVCGPILLKIFLRPITRPCQNLERSLGVNIEIVAEQLCFSVMKSTSHNTVS